MFDTSGLRLRMPSPQDENAGIAARCNSCDTGVGNCLPPALRMAPRQARLDGQRIVEQQHALPCPRAEVAVRRARKAEIGFALLVDVHQAGRHLYARWHRKAQAHRLPRTVVRVLAEDHHLHPVERCQLERLQPHPARRVDRLARGFLCAEEPAELPRAVAGQHAFEHGLPARGDRVVCHGPGTTPPNARVPAPLSSNPRCA